MRLKQEGRDVASPDRTLSTDRQRDQVVLKVTRCAFEEIQLVEAVPNVETSGYLCVRPGRLPHPPNQIHST